MPFLCNHPRLKEVEVFLHHLDKNYILRELLNLFPYYLILLQNQIKISPPKKFNFNYNTNYNTIKQNSKKEITMNENTDEIYEKVMNSGILEQGIKIGMKKGREIGREEGIEKGIKEGIEEGREEGIKEGREEGRKEGREEGIKEGRFNLAIELKNTLLN
ncbi:hypothetical protein sm9_2125 [Methanobrevibacter millerae]|uniref:Flagellar assembly protein H n=2 Tax=Methanobrevibacter millerae TaxID=230361 RepID=A0A0U3DTW9_9EURY|nr:hypothetical protein sm9_2125 [Methanobrevibacter millerae]